MSTEELTDICQNSTFLLLGGLGFSGLNPTYNAKSGLYRNTITQEEDIRRTNRFQMVYEKISICAKDCRVLVLTHTPITDWSHIACNSKWIYINGHTHRNKIEKTQSKALVLSDNQVGYKPKQWRLKNISLFFFVYIITCLYSYVKNFFSSL